MDASEGPPLPISTSTPFAPARQKLAPPFSRIVHRHKTLKDDDLVPDDSVDNGEQEEVEEVLGGEGLELSYLWVVDAGKVLSRSKKSTSDTEGSSHTAKGGTTTDSEVRNQYGRAGCGRARAFHTSLPPLDGVPLRLHVGSERPRLGLGSMSYHQWRQVGHFSFSRCSLVFICMTMLPWDYGIFSLQPH